MQPQFTGGVQVVILSCPAEHKGELWVECLQEIVAQGVKFCLGSSIWHLWGQGSLCISAEGTPAQGDQFNQEKAENNIQEPVSTSSLTVKSQRLEQEQMRSVFVWLCTPGRFSLFCCLGTALAPGRGLWAGDLGISCLGVCCCWLLLYWIPEHIINSPYQCIVCRHRSPQAVAVRINLPPSFLPSFQAFPIALWATGEFPLWCPWQCLALVALFPLSSPFFRDL